MVSKRITLPVFFLFLLGVGGCASYKHGKIDVLKPGNYPSHITVSGVSLAADPYDSTEKTKTGFYVDVNNMGYYPVHLVFSNDSNEMVMLERHKIQLLDPNGSPATNVRSTGMADDCEYNKLAYALLGFGIFSYASADDANKKMAADWRDKELAEQVIIPPGKTMHGFLYFWIPEEKGITRYTLKAEVEKIDSKVTVPLQVALGPMGRKPKIRKGEPMDPLHPEFGSAR